MNARQKENYEIEREIEEGCQSKVSEYLKSTDGSGYSKRDPETVVEAISQLGGGKWGFGARVVVD